MPVDEEISNDTLRKLPPFTELSVEDLRKVTSITKLCRIEKSKILFSEGDTYRGFYIILKGAIKIFRLSSDGKESIFHLIKPFDSFGDIALFEGGYYPVNAQALNNSVLLFFPRKDFLNLLKKNPLLSYKMLASFAKRLRYLTQKIEDLSTKDITKRLASYLVEEINKNGTANLPEPFIRLDIPKKNIAGYLGTITETLSRTFKKLQNEKVIRVSGKTISILDPKKLERLSS